MSRPSRSLRRGNCDAVPEGHGIARRSPTALLMLPNDDFHKAMTLQGAKSIARHLGLTLRQLRSGNYRVNFRDGTETTAY